MKSANKWLILGGLLTILNLGIFLADSLNAAPSDIKGSGNVAVASYTTIKGTYTLWSSGLITDSESGEGVAPPYGPAPGFAKPSVRPGEPVGSPRVAVDYVQDDDGTYTLFADGSVQKADDEGASAPAGGSVEIKFGIAMPNSMPPIEHGIDMPDTYHSGGPFSFKEPFKEAAILIRPVREGVTPSNTTKISVAGVGPDGGRFPNFEVAVGGNLTWEGTWVIAIGK